MRMGGGKKKKKINESRNQIQRRGGLLDNFLGKLRMAYRLINRDNHSTRGGGWPAQSGFPLERFTSEVG